MKKHLILLLTPLLGLVVLQPCSVCAQESGAQGTGGQAQSASGKLAKDDQKFATKALKGGMAEVKMGQLASEKAKRMDVREFGQQMVKDHGEANAKLKNIAKEKGIKIPEKLGGKDSKTYDRLAQMQGEAFDQAYIDEMVKDHKKDVAEFEEATTKLKDPDLKAFATKTLPVLKSHLQKITEIRNAGKQ